ncbi:MAG: hypothetical protein ACRD68_09130, partial [Pyrinomonadaceae bacterium]
MTKFKSVHAPACLFALLCLAALACAAGAGVAATAVAQDQFPAPPADRVPVYFSDERNRLVPLQFEAGETPLRTDVPAPSNKKSYAELKGERAVHTVGGDSPRFYLFVPDTSGVRVPFLVRLAARRGARRVTTIAQRGERGFAIPTAEIVPP